MSIEKAKSGTYFYNFMIKGYREHNSIKNCKSEQDAKKYEAERIKIVEFMLDGKIVPDAKVQLFLDKKANKDKKIYTIDFLCNALINNYIKKENKSLSKVITHTKFFMDFFGSDTDVTSIDEEKIILMIKELETHKSNSKNKLLSNATINRYMSSLKRGYNILNKDRDIKLNYYPFNDEELTKRYEKPKKITVIPPELEKQFFAAFPVPQNHIVELYFNLGLRISNVTHLNKSQIDLINGRVKIAPEDNKGKKEIDLKLNQRAKEIILMYYDKADYYLFTHTKGKYKGNPIKRINKSWETAIKSLGLDEEITPHAGRKSFGTKVYNKTKDILLAKELLYHSDVKTTMAYLGISQKQKDDVMENLNN